MEFWPGNVKEHQATRDQRGGGSPLAPCRHITLSLHRLAPGPSLVSMLLRLRSKDEDLMEIYGSEMNFNGAEACDFHFPVFTMSKFPVGAADCSAGQRDFSPSVQIGPHLVDFHAI